MYLAPVLEAQRDSSKVLLCTKAFQCLKIAPNAWCIHRTNNINDMCYDQLVSDLSTNVKKRRKDSILFRHTDMVGTAPEEHFIESFSIMWRDVKASVFL